MAIADGARRGGERGRPFLLPADFFSLCPPPLLPPVLDCTTTPLPPVIRSIHDGGRPDPTIAKRSAQRRGPTHSQRVFSSNHFHNTTFLFKFWRPFLRPPLSLSLSFFAPPCVIWCCSFTCVGLATGTSHWRPPSQRHGQCRLRRVQKFSPLFPPKGRLPPAALHRCFPTHKGGWPAGQRWCLKGVPQSAHCQTALRLGGAPRRGLRTGSPATLRLHQRRRHRGATLSRGGRLCSLTPTCPASGEGEKFQRSRRCQARIGGPHRWHGGQAGVPGTALRIRHPATYAGDKFCTPAL